MNDIRNRIINSKRIVIKVGTSTITYSDGSLNLRVLDKLTRVLADLKNRKKEIVLVTSGAIGVGMSKMGMSIRPDSMPQKQALAAIGQVNLMYIYSKFFNEYGQTTAQVLLTKDIIMDKTKKRNAYNTFNTLLDYGVIPIVNENDTISTEEIESTEGENMSSSFGDNDTLSAVVSVLIEAELLILLSDINGLYNKNPKYYNDAHLIPLVKDIDAKITNISGDTSTHLGTGGMKTKILAANICSDANIPMIIANGDNPSNINRILEGNDVGTLFLPSKS